MALIKSIDTSYGITATYSNISSVTLDNKTSLLVTVSHFVDIDHKLSGASPITTTNFTFDTNLDECALYDDLWACAYEFLKLTPMFENAVSDGTSR